MDKRYTYLNEERAYRNRRRAKKEKRQREICKKVIFFLFTICLVIGMSLSYRALLAKANSASDMIQYKYYKNISVAYGDTLWSLASENYENGYASVDDYIYEVKEINHLKEDTIQAGQFLILPYYSSEFK